MKKAFWAGLILAALGTSTALAGVIEDRQDIMKNNNNASRVLGGMARGTAPFDAAAAKAQLQMIVDGVAKLPTLFPAGSDQGTGTTKTLALPTVWSDTAGFKTAAAKLGSDAQAAMAATDQASFATAFQTVQADCGACHKTYRAAPPRPAGAAPAGGGMGAPPAQ
jgi:cytochrome c556